MVPTTGTFEVMTETQRATITRALLQGDDGTGIGSVIKVVTQDNEEYGHCVHSLAQTFVLLRGTAILVMVPVEDTGVPAGSESITYLEGHVAFQVPANTAYAIFLSPDSLLLHTDPGDYDQRAAFSVPVPFLSAQFAAMVRFLGGTEVGTTQPGRTYELPGDIRVHIDGRDITIKQHGVDILASPVDLRSLLGLESLYHALKFYVRLMAKQRRS